MSLTTWPFMALLPRRAAGSMIRPAVDRLLGARQPERHIHRAVQLGPRFFRPLDLVVQRAEPEVAAPRERAHAQLLRQRRAALAVELLARPVLVGAVGALQAHLLPLGRITTWCCDSRAARGTNQGGRRSSARSQDALGSRAPWHC